MLSYFPLTTALLLLVCLANNSVVRVRKAEPHTIWKISGNVDNGKCAGVTNLFRRLKSLVTRTTHSPIWFCRSDHRGGAVSLVSLFPNPLTIEKMNCIGHLFLDCIGADQVLTATGTASGASLMQCSNPGKVLISSDLRPGWGDAP